MVSYIVLLTYRKGTQVDEGNKRIKFFTAVLGIKFGRFVDVSKFATYRYERAKDYRLNSRGSSATFKNPNYNLYLVEKDTKREFLVSTSPQTETKHLLQFFNAFQE